MYIAEIHSVRCSVILVILGFEIFVDEKKSNLETN